MYTYIHKDNLHKVTTNKLHFYNVHHKHNKVDKNYTPGLHSLVQSQPLSMILFVLEDLKCIPSTWLITFLRFLVRSYVKILASYLSLGIYILFIRITKFLVRFHFWDTKGTSAVPISHQKKKTVQIFLVQFAKV